MLLAPSLGCATATTIPPATAEHARALMAENPVIDLHADPLLWNRDLSRRSRRGQVDFPRLREGRVALQLIGLASGGPPFRSAFPVFGWWHGWPRSALATYRSRVEWQLDQLDRFLRASAEPVAVVRSPAEFAAAWQRRVLAVMPVIEGGQSLLGDIRLLDHFHRRGVGGLSLAHFDRNDLGGSSFHGDERRRGLSPFGRQVIARMNDLGMLVDLAHASEQTLVDAAQASRAPCIVSHTGVAGGKRHWRNLSDDDIRAVARRGGVIGIILATNFLGGKRVEDVVRHIEHVIAVAGPAHVAIGTDLDGLVPIPTSMRDVTDLWQIPALLLARGHSEEVVRGFLGGNFLRVWEEVWRARKLDGPGANQ